MVFFFLATTIRHRRGKGGLLLLRFRAPDIELGSLGLGWFSSLVSSSSWGGGVLVHAVCWVLLFREQ